MKPCDAAVFLGRTDFYCEAAALTWLYIEVSNLAQNANSSLKYVFVFYSGYKFRFQSLYQKHETFLSLKCRHCHSQQKLSHISCFSSSSVMKYRTMWEIAVHGSVNRRSYQPLIKTSPSHVKRRRGNKRRHKRLHLTHLTHRLQLIHHQLSHWTPRAAAQTSIKEGNKGMLGAKFSSGRIDKQRRDRYRQRGWQVLSWGSVEYLKQPWNTTSTSLKALEKEKKNYENITW